MRRISILVVLLLVVLANGFAQQFSLNHRLLLHLGYSTIKSNTFISPAHEFIIGGQQNSKFSAEIGYKILPELSLSGYIANSKIGVNHFESNDDNSFYISVSTKGATFYGINARLHCLPLFIKERKMRIDLYLIGSVGIVSTFTNELTSEELMQVYEKPFWESGGGLGLSYNFTKHLGVFGEYQLGKFYNDQKSQWKAGALVTF